LEAALAASVIRSRFLVIVAISCSILLRGLCRSFILPDGAQTVETQLPFDLFVIDYSGEQPPVRNGIRNQTRQLEKIFRGGRNRPNNPSVPLVMASSGVLDVYSFCRERWAGQLTEFSCAPPRFLAIGISGASMTRNGYTT